MGWITHSSVGKHRQIARLKKAGHGVTAIARRLNLSYHGVWRHYHDDCKCQGHRFATIKLRPINWKKDVDRQCAACKSLFAVETVFYKGDNRAKWPICLVCRSEGINYHHGLLERSKSKAWQKTDGRRASNPDRDEEKARWMRAFSKRPGVSERKRAYDRAYYEAHKEALKAKAIAYHWRNRDKVLEKMRERYRGKADTGRA